MIFQEDHFIEFVLGFICLVLMMIVLKLISKNKNLVIENKKLTNEVSLLEKNLEETLKRLWEFENKNIPTDGLLQRAVEGLVGLGTPGIILLVAISMSGFHGAAAITTTLAMFGGPFGMVTGVGVLLFSVYVSQAVAKYGMKTLVPLVLNGLLEKNIQKEKIISEIEKYPNWVLTKELRAKIKDVLKIEK
jgi:hypothetical protein